MFIFLPNFYSGRKGNAPTFLTDDNFNIALAAILKKDKKKIQITVEFDTDTMSGYSEGQNLYNVSNISSKSTITLDPKKAMILKF